MYLKATTRSEAVALVYGASVSDDGRVLHCGWLFIAAHNTQKTLTLKDAESKKTYRVRLPKTAVGNTSRLRYTNEPLEILK